MVSCPYAAAPESLVSDVAHEALKGRWPNTDDEHHLVRKLACPVRMEDDVGLDHGGTQGSGRRDLPSEIRE